MDVGLTLLRNIQRPVVAFVSVYVQWLLRPSAPEAVTGLRWANFLRRTVGWRYLLSNVTIRLSRSARFVQRRASVCVFKCVE